MVRPPHPSSGKFSYHNQDDNMPLKTESTRLERMLNEALLDVCHQELSVVVDGYRDKPRPTSWNQIAFNIQTITDIEVSGEWLRQKYGS